MTEEVGARWLFYECPKCGSDMTIQDKFGVFCPIKGCEWKASGADAEQFVKLAEENYDSSW